MEPKHKDHNPQDQSASIERASDSTSVKKERREIACDDPESPQNDANQSRGIVRLILRNNWVAGSSILITVLTAYFLWDSNRLARKALTNNASQFRATMQAMGEQTAAAQKQINVDIDALRLDQRPWLGYWRYAIESRAKNTTKWEVREPKSGELFRIRLNVQNVGKTPALNVRLMSTKPQLIRTGTRPSEPKKEQWREVTGTFFVFPDDSHLSYASPSHHLSSQDFSKYSDHTSEAFFWARLEYCDTTGQHHWTQVGLARHFQTPVDVVRIRASSVSPDPGEANHPGCKN